MREIASIMIIATGTLVTTAVDKCVAATIVSKLGERMCNGALHRSKQNNRESDCQIEHVQDSIEEDGF